MLCPCCGKDIPLGAQQCRCGARFVGEAARRAAIQSAAPRPRDGCDRDAGGGRRLGAHNHEVARVCSPSGYLGVAARDETCPQRARRLRRLPHGCGHAYRNAGGGARWPQATPSLTCRRSWKTARRSARPTRAREFYRVASKLEAYKRKYGSFPSTPQDYAKAIDERMPIDYWEKRHQVPGLRRSGSIFAFIGGGRNIFRKFRIALGRR